jgi:hypothetical protein
MLGIGNGRNFMKLHARRALPAGAKPVTAAIIFMSLVAGTRAQETKLDTESYTIPSGDRD